MNKFKTAASILSEIKLDLDEEKITEETVEEAVDNCLNKAHNFAVEFQYAYFALVDYYTKVEGIKFMTVNPLYDNFMRQFRVTTTAVAAIYGCRGLDKEELELITVKSAFNGHIEGLFNQPQESRLFLAHKRDLYSWLIDWYLLTGDVRFLKIGQAYLFYDTGSSETSEYMPYELSRYLLVTDSKGFTEDYLRFRDSIDRPICMGDASQKVESNIMGVNITIPVREFISDFFRGYISWSIESAGLIRALIAYC